MRRIVVMCTVWALAAAIAGGSTMAAQEPIRIGLIVPLTGNFAPNGRDMVNGLKLGLAQVANKAARREIQVLVEDDQGAPAQSLTKARKLVELDKVSMLMGPLTSSSGYALRDYVDEQKIPMVYPILGPDDLTQRKGSPWIIRTGATGSQPLHALGEYAARTLHYKRVVSIAYDFAFGWETVAGFQDTFEQNGGRVVEHLWPPIGAPDYSPYLARIPRDVDAVYATFSGADALRFLQQAQAFGLKGRLPIIGAGTLTDEHILFEQGELAGGIITALHYSPALRTPANRAFVQAYIKVYNRVPSYYSEGTYTGALFVLKAIESVSGRVENHANFASAIRKVALAETPRGPIRLDDWGNPIENVYIRRVDIVNRQPQNTIIYTYPQISQFWTTNPQEYLKRPVYTRDVPPAHP